MTNPNFTSINVLIDESGSMAGLTDETISGLNTFVEQQKKLPGKATISVTKFNYRAQSLVSNVPLDTFAGISRISYEPSGGTALLDALGSTIDSLGTALRNMKPKERPGKVVFLIITDGEENASCEYGYARIQEMVKLQSETYNWEFIFLGANVDAFAAGQKLGIAGMNSIQYDANAQGVEAVYSNISAGLGAMRSNGAYATGDFFGRSHNAHSVSTYTGGKSLVNMDGTLAAPVVVVDTTIKVDTK